LQPIDKQSLKRWFLLVQEHNLLPIVEESLAKTITTYAGSPVLFSPPTIGISSTPRPYPAKGLIRFETEKFGAEISISITDQYFAWIFKRMFGRESKANTSDAEHLLCELLNIGLGVANAHFGVRGEAGRFSFPQPLSGSKLLDFHQSCPREVVVVPFQCAENPDRSGILEFFPTDSLGIAWNFDGASFSRPA
jgi:hypothetical protein